MNRLIMFALSLSVLIAIPRVRAAEAKGDKEEKKVEIDPEVEKALKAAGWTDIKGSWKKIKPNVYEVTDGSLETNKVDGTLSLTVDAGSKGTVGAYVRNCHEAKDYAFQGSNNLVTHIVAHTGYGVEVDEKKCLVLGAVKLAGLHAQFVPAKSTELLLHPNENTVVSVSVHDVQLQTDVNGKTPNRGNFKISKDGPFAIVVTGTATIEAPTVKD